MTRDETKKLIRIIAATYPNYKPASLEDAINVWTVLLAHDKYEDMEACLYAYIRSDTSGFAPSPGQLINIRSKAQTDDGLTEGEAWALVRRAICDGYYHAEERYAELPKPVQRAVGSPMQLRAWATEDADTVVQSNFLRAYRQVKARNAENASISPQIMELLTKTSEKLMIGD